MAGYHRRTSSGRLGARATANDDVAGAAQLRAAAIRERAVASARAVDQTRCRAPTLNAALRRAGAVDVTHSIVAGHANPLSVFCDLLTVFVIPREEAELVRKFDHEYREYKGIAIPQPSFGYKLNCGTR